MKTLTKVAIIGASIAFLGGVVYVTAASIEYNRKADKITAPREDTFYFQNDLTDINGIAIEAIADDIIIKGSENANITIQYNDHEDDPFYDLSVKDGVLTMKHNADFLKGWSDFHWPWESFPNTEHHVITVNVPSNSSLGYSLVNVSGDITVSNIKNGIALGTVTVSGTTTLSNLYFKDKISIVSTSGSQSLDTVITNKDINLNTVSGHIEGWAVYGQNISTNAVSGKTSLSAISFGKKLDCDSVSGSILIEIVDDDYYKVDANTVSGNIYKNVKLSDDAEKTIEADTVSGSISIGYNGKPA